MLKIIINLIHSLKGNLKGSEMMRGNKIIKDQSGAAMVIVLIMIMVLTLISLGSAFNSIYELKFSGNKRGTTDAFYGADSGVQVALSNVTNFDLEKFFSDKYDPFTDGNNSNVTKATVLIGHLPDRKGAPRGFGISAVNFNFEHYLVESTGYDNIDLGSIKPSCTIEQKMVRLVPTQQGGY